jgi:signal transduction histidine kinase
MRENNLSSVLIAPLKRLIQALLKLSMLRVAVLFLVGAMVVAVILGLAIDFLWDGRFSAELEFAGVVVSLLDGMLIVGFLVTMLSELRKEVQQRRMAEDALRTMNQQLGAAQEELVRKEKLALLGEVAGSLGHELRKPLGVMSNAVYFLQTVFEGGDDSVNEYLGIILAEITRSEHIVDELLATVRTRPPDVAAHGVAELVGQILRQCVVPDSVTVTLDIPATIPPLRVDELQMQQVLRNLISNSVEAMVEGGTLAINAVENRQEGTVRLSVRDSGSGMTPEVMAQLFQPLFTTKARGIGLGLVVAKNLTEANGGTVTVESEPEKGTLFAITLPSDVSAGETA